MRGRTGGKGLIAAVACFSLVVGAACIGLALDDRPLSVALGLVAALAAALATFAEPFVGLTLFLATVYLRPGDRFPVLEPLRLTLVIAAGTMAIWLAQYLLTRRPPLRRHPVNRDLAGFLAAALLSHVRLSVRAGIALVVGGLAKSVAVCILLINLVRTPLRLRVTAWLVVLMSAVNAVWAYRDTRLGESKFGERAAGVGILGDPNDLALTLVIALPLAIALWQAERGFYRRLILILAIGCLLGGVLVCESRGGYLGLAVVLFLEGYERIPWRQFRTAYTVLAVAVGLVGLNVLFAQRGGGLGEVANDPNVVNRRGAWVAGFRMLKAYPLTGVGLYQFPDRIDDFAPAWVEQRNITAHNSVVLVAAELGLPGLFFFLSLLWHVWVSSRRIRQRLTKSGATRTQYYLGQAVGRMLVGWIVCALFLSQAYQFWLFVTVGLVLASEGLLTDADDAVEVAA